MKKPLSRLYDFSNYWPLLLIGSVLLIIFSIIATKRISHEGELDGSFIFNSSSSTFSIKPLNQDSLGVFSNSLFELNSSEELTRQQIKNSLHFEPGLNYALSGKNNNWKIRLEKPLAYGEIIKARLITYQNLNLASSSKKIWSWAYQAQDKFEVLYSQPTNQSTNVGLEENLIITLSHNNFFEGQKHLIINPPIKGVVFHIGRKLIFKPQEKWQPNTIYRITLKHSLPIIKSKTTLDNDYDFAFQTTAFAEVEKKLINNQEIRQFNTDQPITFEINNPENQKIKASLYKLASADDFIKSLKKNENPWWSNDLINYKADLSNAEELLSFSSNKEDLDLPFKLSKGFYLLKLNDSLIDNFIWFQISDLDLYSNFGQRKTLIWAKKSNQVISGVDFILEDMALEEKTDKEGLALFETPTKLLENFENKQYKQFYLIAKKDSDETVLPLVDFNNYIFSSQEALPEKKVAQINLNKNQFSNEEAIIIKIETEQAELANLNIKLERADQNYYDYNGQALFAYKNLEKINNNTIKINDEFIPGDYFVNLYHKNNLIDKKLLTISNCSAINNTAEENNYSLILPDQQSEQLRIINPLPYYSEGALIKTVFNLPPDQKSPVLFLQYREGFRWYTINQKPLYDFYITKNLLPSFTLFSIAYNNHAFYQGEIWPLVIKNDQPLNFSGSWSQKSSLPLIKTETQYQLFSTSSQAENIKNNDCTDWIKKELPNINKTGQLSIYQLSDGGLSLDNQANYGNLKLSALISLNGQAINYDLIGLKAFFIKNLDNENKDEELTSFSLAGLTGLGEKNLNTINNWLNYRKEASNEEKSYLIIALKKLGANEWADDITKHLDKKTLSNVQKKLLDYQIKE